MVVAPFIPLFPFIKYPLSRYLQRRSTTALPLTRYRRKDAGDLGPGCVEPKSPPNILLAPQPW